MYGLFSKYLGYGNESWSLMFRFFKTNFRGIVSIELMTSQ